MPKLIPTYPSVCLVSAIRDFLPAQDRIRSPFTGKLRVLITRLVFVLQMMALFAGASCAYAQDVTTWHYDTARSGVQPAETVLTPANVNSGKFGKVFSLPVVGDTYAQPLYLHQYPMSDGKLHNVLLVATSEDYVYAFDADGKNPSPGYLWRKLLVGSGETWLTYLDEYKDYDVYPNIGIISTPVVDRAGGTIYVVSRSKTTSGTTKYFQRLHALAISSGAEKLNGPATIQATVPGLGDGGTTITFNPRIHNQRAALLLASTPGVGSGNSVFIAWASHGDQGPYHGWVMAYDAANVAKQNAAWVDTPNGKQGGIWMTGGGPSTDNYGNIFLAGGNGTFNANNGGHDFGDSVLRLGLSTSGIVMRGYFTPADQSSLNTSDLDVGSGAVTLLPIQSGSVPNLALTVDKSGTIYLVNRDHMGGYTTPANSSIQSFSSGYRNRSSFAFFNNTLYGGFDAAPLQAWSFQPQTELFTTTPQSKSGPTYGCGGCNGAGTVPSVSANGTSNGIVWSLNYTGFNHTPAILYAYDAANLATELYASTQAANGRDAAAIATKFTTPTVANGRVYVGGRNAITVYGLFSGGTPPAATPRFSPPGGVYASAQTVSITDATPNASIYYTTNGTPASTGSTLYTAPIPVSASKTLESVAIAPGYSQSAEAVAGYTIGGGSCSAPSSAGLHVCKPVSGSANSSPVQVQATATITGTLARMEVWVDGVKKYTETTSKSLNTSISLAAGSHRFGFYAVNTAGTIWEKTVVASVK